MIIGGDNMVIENRVKELYPEADAIFNPETEVLFAVIPRSVNKGIFKRDIMKDMDYNGLYYRNLKVVKV
jgi:hypothetical protein